MADPDRAQALGVPVSLALVPGCRALARAAATAVRGKVRADQLVVRAAAIAGVGADRRAAGDPAPEQPEPVLESRTEPAPAVPETAGRAALVVPGRRFWGRVLAVDARGVEC